MYINFTKHIIIDNYVTISKQSVHFKDQATRHLYCEESNKVQINMWTKCEDLEW